jgi:hypothetical protein
LQIKDSWGANHRSAQQGLKLLAVDWSCRPVACETIILSGVPASPSESQRVPASPVSSQRVSPVEHAWIVRDDLRTKRARPLSALVAFSFYRFRLEINREVGDCYHPALWRRLRKKATQNSLNADSQHTHWRHCADNVMVSSALQRRSHYHKKIAAGRAMMLCSDAARVNPSTDF